MPASQSSSVLVVGAGIVGVAAAWQLAEQGHAVTLVDPALGGDPTEPSGSQAALGILMARVFHRSSGRAWRLRQQSHALWNHWLADLGQRGHQLRRRQGLLLLAASDDDLSKQQRIAADRERLGIPMQLLGPADLARVHPALPGRPLGALFSPEDSQLDPGPVMDAMHAEARKAGVECVAERALRIERQRPWRLILASGRPLEAPWLVLALGMGTAPLLEGIGLPLHLEPVLGQALELELAADPNWQWPGAVVWQGVNLVPRPDLHPGGRRLWLGATLEPGMQGSPEAVDHLRHLGGDAPEWLEQATVVRSWSGLRCHPQGRPAPVLEEPEPGLLVASGHYRNGVLLAPATAAWLCERIGGAPPVRHPPGEPAP